MKLHYFIIFALLLTLSISACKQRESTSNPWGEVKEEDVSTNSPSLQLDDIISNGELIMVTTTGPDTYYEYHGRGMGLHYLLLQNFCEHIGVTLRVDICKDTTDMINRLKNGEADVMAMPLNINPNDVRKCLSKASDNKWHWLVNQDNSTLADTLDQYFTSKLIKKVSDDESFLLSTASVKRHVYSPMLNRSKGVISEYDYLFKKYAPVARLDWHLMAAQCYQESCFDPNARSWVGACGLMQIMPSTADHLGLSRAKIYDPESNIAASARYMAELAQSFTDIPNPTEKLKFVLASYNGGTRHIRDAMALAKKFGYSPYRWDDVSAFVLKLQQPLYYNDPVVKNGYMRGSETANYVARIYNRWLEYRGMKGGMMPVPSADSQQPNNIPQLAPNLPAPHPSAKRKEKYNL